ncbi:MAG: ACR3 family arsenite efflux transporter [Dehalococcoidia bacterium]|nr:ACR3 family arsenite efflux transporter [Dehalococcoidia bacterium]
MKESANGPLTAAWQRRIGPPPEDPSTLQKSAAPAEHPDSSVLAQLSTLDRFLPVWIGIAMALGLLLGRAFPDLNDQLDRVKIDQTSLPIAIGLLGMMYPVLAKVRYDRLGDATTDKPLVGSSVMFAWLIGPALMFTLAWVFLRDLPEYRTGVILVGLAPCIAMVLIWNSLAHGDIEAGAVLVVLNSFIQVAAYAVMGYFYLETLPGWLGLQETAVDFVFWDIAKSVLIFLGVPLVLGLLTSVIGRRRKGDVWYEQRFLPRIGPWALYSLLFTITVLFAIQGDAITSQPLDVARIAVPFLLYFALMWTAAFAWGRGRGLPYPKTATLAFTAAGNNFELAIAVAIGAFGVTSGQALAGVVGPLIEVPVLVALVYVSLWGRRFFERTTDQGSRLR